MYLKMAHPNNSACDIRVDIVKTYRVHWKHISRKVYLLN